MRPSSPSSPPSSLPSSPSSSPSPPSLPRLRARLRLSTFYLTCLVDEFPPPSPSPISPSVVGLEPASRHRRRGTQVPLIPSILVATLRRRDRYQAAHPRSGKKPWRCQLRADIQAYTAGGLRFASVYSFPSQRLGGASGLVIGIDGRSPHSASWRSLNARGKSTLLFAEAEQQLTGCQQLSEVLHKPNRFGEPYVNAQGLPRLRVFFVLTQSFFQILA